MARTLRNQIGVAAAALAVLGVIFLASFPSRAYLAQREQKEHLATEATQLGHLNSDLRQRAAELDSDEEIERLARLHYHLVRPGEEAYVLLPSEAAAPTSPQPSASASVATEEPSWLGRLWNRIESIL